MVCVFVSNYNLAEHICTLTVFRRMKTIMCYRITCFFLYFLAVLCMYCQVFHVLEDSHVKYIMYAGTILMVPLTGSRTTRAGDKGERLQTLVYFLLLITITIDLFI